VGQLFNAAWSFTGQLIKKNIRLLFFVICRADVFVLKLTNDVIHHTVLV